MSCSQRRLDELLAVVLVEMAAFLDESHLIGCRDLVTRAQPDKS